VRPEAWTRQQSNCWLDKALQEFPEDVAAAAAQASGWVAKLKAPTDPRAEPWPPMKAGIGL
jgi:hypothetical protein